MARYKVAVVVVVGVVVVAVERGGERGFDDDTITDFRLTVRTGHSLIAVFHGIQSMQMKAHGVLGS